ncbi:hypothetical protein ACFC60_39900 [Kitasatospora purpeofusca]|uniref:hypothetical protein n=1 Tax=Kitasatospora purpeofusca TaxID=67352 RepID=UPI0035D54017
MESEVRGDARREVERELQLRRDRPNTNHWGFGLGSVVIDTRDDGRLAIVNGTRWQHVFLRAPGRDDEMWMCPLGHVARATPVQADLVRAIDLSAFPPVTISKILENPASDFPARRTKKPPKAKEPPEAGP